ncbi:hypothetical protein N9Y89_00110 [bacterium]|nr:hypothetical protein [bacterium]
MKVVNSIGQEVYENSLEIKGTFDTKIGLSGLGFGNYATPLLRVSIPLRTSRCILMESKI